MAYILSPIWKDRYVDFGAVSEVPFRISVGGDVIYHGISYRRPNGQNRVRVNDVCADYMVQTVPNISQAAFTKLSFPLLFTIEMYEDGEWVAVENYKFTYDWSYDNLYNFESRFPSSPINGRVLNSQFLMVTSNERATDVTFTLTFKDGQTQHIVIDLTRSVDYNESYNDDFSKYAIMMGAGTAILYLGNWSNLASVDVNGIHYDVVSCGSRVLYYINAYGGWDSFLIEGNVVERDQVNRMTRNVSGDNQDNTIAGEDDTYYTQRGEYDNYANGIVKEYTMHTGWLSDEQSAKMHHLLNSTKVYMLDDDTLKPVLIKNSTTEYKTYKNNGGKLVNYTIDVELNQKRMRR